jgi:hypothetical protein
MRGFTQACQIGIALPLAVMNRIRRQNGGYLRADADQRELQNVTRVPGRLRLIPPRFMVRRAFPCW